MQYIVNTIFGLFVLLVMWGCNDIDIDNYESKVVVDGWIEPGLPAKVLLTKSAPYFGEIDSVIIRNYALTHAKVKLNNGNDEEVLTLRSNHGFFPPYIYVSTNMIGEVGKKYHLTIEVDGATITASTTIPEPLKLENAYMKLNDDSDSLGIVTVEFSDPGEKENYYMFFTKDENVKSRFMRVFSPPVSDEFFSGQQISFNLQKGSNNQLSNYDNLFYNVNDTITIKFCTIDYESYQFWVSFQKELINTTNPFAATTSMVKSNVVNGLGVWCGYGSYYYTVYP